MELYGFHARERTISGGNMSDSLVNRLRGQYNVGPDGEFGTRNFSDFIPPISLEAADRIEELENALALIKFKWISVEEDLPKTGRGDPIRYAVLQDGEAITSCWSGRHFYSEDAFEGKITHWFELPPLL